MSLVKGTFIVYVVDLIGLLIFPLCSGGRDVPKDQSKVNVDCVYFNLSILRKKQKNN